ncbi:hypothetical protein DC522_11785 [Microvirga sp. KLBC 81]|uniref:hypothetical protein n=1 Tax=Microvirga sp. KLBC 81 TaxID=1862707 RepID=UPI000D5170DA|nr:hypothetical protein [Microvirga sp. KLBC 81]PVE24163.1 hypothetical protein DC522_11785 [Microvirga sp. KLBC 81]
MSFGVKRVVLGVVAALTVGGATQASELSFTVPTNGYDLHQNIADYGNGSFERNDYSHREHWSEHRDPGRYYGRPVPEWKERRPHWGAYYGVPVAERPVFAGPRWGYHEDCRIIIKERVNRWGETVQVRREVCR